jgi:hypothetical protein
MGSLSGFINEGSASPPKLRVYLNLDNLAHLQIDSLWGGHEGLASYQRLLGDGFEGVQLTTDAPAVARAPLPHCGLDRINTPGDVRASQHWSALGQFSNFLGLDL